MSKVEQYSDQTFEGIKHVDELGEEFWLARELQNVLEYTKWENFHKVVERAMLACKNSGYRVLDHFPDIRKTILMPKSAERQVADYKLTRYACYLIVQNGDPRKEVIAVGQTYFAVKTRQSELVENYEQLSENQKRLAIRSEMSAHNKSLAEAAKMSGVKTPLEYAIFQNQGYQGLYGGLGMKDVHTKKGLKESQKILDHMGSTELAANLFRATQTDDKLRRENIRGKYVAYQTHHDVGVKVRQTIKELGGTMPEELPTPEKSIKQLEGEAKKLTKHTKVNGNENILPE